MPIQKWDTQQLGDGKSNGASDANCRSEHAHARTLEALNELHSQSQERDTMLGRVVEAIKEYSDSITSTPTEVHIRPNKFVIS